MTNENIKKMKYRSTYIENQCDKSCQPEANFGQPNCGEIYPKERGRELEE